MQPAALNFFLRLGDVVDVCFHLHARHQVQLMRRPPRSVTRFCEIVPLWHNFKKLGQIFEWFFRIWQYFYSTLAKMLCYSASFHGYRRHFKKYIWSHCYRPTDDNNMTWRTRKKQKVPLEGRDKTHMWRRGISKITSFKVLFVPRWLRSGPVRPDVEIKSCPNVLIVAQKVVKTVFTFKSGVFKIAQKVTLHSWYFC